MANKKGQGLSTSHAGCIRDPGPIAIPLTDLQERREEKKGADDGVERKDQNGGDDKIK